MIATLRIARDAISLTAAGANHRGKVDIAAFCADRDEMLIGELWQTLDLDLTPENHRRLITEGLAVTLRIPVSKPPRYLKVVVYDHTADRTRSIVGEIKR